jgi:beta-N-acetylhexosaminidase
MLGFTGHEPSPEILAMVSRRPLGGLTLFRALNIVNPAQVRELNSALQRAAHESGQPPLLIGVDQEGGTLIAIPGTTPFPGNLALGATRSPELAYKTGHALGRELAAMGINVNYAPVCDVNVNPRNPVTGPRSFGEDPAMVAQLAAAMVEGLQAAGVAAAPKHFPGHGGTASDSHHSTPVVLHDEARLRRVEFPPFAAVVKAGAKMMMTAHIALPRLNQGAHLPATLSPPILGMLRNELGFEGVIISDALDMGAVEQGPPLIVEAIAAANAGVDMLLLTTKTDQQGLYAGLLQAARRSLLSPQAVRASAERVLALKHWASQRSQPPLEIIGCADHRGLAEEIAERSVTLVRDSARRLPLRLDSNARVAVILPQPQDLTPADTSSYETPSLAPALRAYHPNVDEFIIPLNPSDSDVAALRQRLSVYDLVVIGTINAADHPGQAALVSAILERGVATVAVALRMPYDIQACPAAPTYICTYSLQPPSMKALAKALWGQIPFVGQLPVSIPSLTTITSR